MRLNPGELTMLKSRYMICIIVSFWLVPAITAAMTIVECVNKSGESTFSERCPPGSVKKGEKQLRGLTAKNDSEEVSIADVAREHPITLFAVDDCVACGLVKNQLNAREIPFTEINVTGDQEKFKQLTAATGGPATVPTLTIDDKVLSGYNGASLNAALTAAGYPDP